MASSKRSSGSHRDLVFCLTDADLGLPCPYDRVRPRHVTDEEMRSEDYFYARLMAEYRSYEVYTLGSTMGRNMSEPYMALSSRGSKLPVFQNLKKMPASEPQRAKREEFADGCNAVPAEYMPRNCDGSKNLLVQRSGSEGRPVEDVHEKVRYEPTVFNKNYAKIADMGIYPFKDFQVKTNCTAYLPQRSSTTTIQELEDFEEAGNAKMPPPGIVHPTLLQQLTAPPGIPFPLSSKVFAARNQIRLTDEFPALPQRSLKQRYQDDVRSYNRNSVTERMVPRGVFPSTKVLHATAELQESFRFIPGQEMRRAFQPSFNRPTTFAEFDAELGCGFNFPSREYIQPHLANKMKKSSVIQLGPSCDGVVYIQMTASFVVENEKGISAQKKSYSAIVSKRKHDADDE